jgi:hypothetical protein
VSRKELEAILLDLKGRGVGDPPHLPRPGERGAGERPGGLPPPGGGAAGGPHPGPACGSGPGRGTACAWPSPRRRPWRGPWGRGGSPRPRTASSSWGRGRRCGPTFLAWTGRCWRSPGGRPAWKASSSGSLGPLPGARMGG